VLKLSIIKGNTDQIQLSGVRNPSAEMGSAATPSNKSQNVGQLGSQLGMQKRRRSNRIRITILK